MRAWILCVLMALPLAARAAEAPATASAPADQTKVYRLRIRPAGEPTPPLKYRLMPAFIDQRPGNAAMIYYMAAQLAEGVSEEQKEKIANWLDVELDALPLKEASEAIPSAAMDQLELAARREYCDWELPVREQGYDLMLPQLSRFRQIGRMVALQVRLDVAAGRHDDAVGNLQTGYAFSRHVQGPTLIQNLVSTSMAGLLHRPTLELIESPGSPNLYWALAALPRPFVDLSESLQWERTALHVSFPALREVETARLSEEEWRDLLQKMMQLTDATIWGIELGSDVGIMGFVAKMYPQARQYLLAHGYTQEQIEQMPVIQAVLIHQVRDYELWADRMFRWYQVPFAQAYPHMKQWEQSFAEARRRGEVGMLAGMLLPSLTRAYMMTAMADRQIAALQCIEAIRLYAANHDGRLPQRLADIAEVPVPDNPVTGEPFGYRAQGDSAVLEALGPAGEEARHSARYELTMVRNQGANP